MRLAFVIAAGALGVLAAACSDSIHLDPAGPGGNTITTGAGGSGGDGTTSSSGGSGGGAPPIVCESNSDCPAPTAICDSAKNKCVECLEIADCAFRPGTVCSKGVCACPTEGESFCAADGALPDRCADLDTSSTDCGACGPACFGACAAGQCADAWEPTSTTGAPSPRLRHAAVSTGSKMIVWGGDTASGVTNTGGVYDPVTREWTPTSLANAPTPRTWARAVWIGGSVNRMVVWGGSDGSGALGTGGVYDPATNTWKATSTTGAPSPRRLHSVVATADRMIVWGGFDENARLQTGGVYDPVNDTWTATDTGGAPTARQDHTAVLAGSTMIVFGGYGYDPNCPCDTTLTGGAQYNPTNNTWIPLQDVFQPGPRYRHTAVVTVGADPPRMIVWGGFDGTSSLGNGSVFTTTTLAWAAMNDPSPAPRQLHTSVWIGGAVNRMVTWGGDNNGVLLDSGGVYDPGTNKWAPTPTALTARSWHSAVVANDKMIVWGGNTATGITNTGAVLDPAAIP